MPTLDTATDHPNPAKGPSQPELPDLVMHAPKTLPTVTEIHLSPIKRNKGSENNTTSPTTLLRLQNELPKPQPKPPVFSKVGFSPGSDIFSPTRGLEHTPNLRKTPYRKSVAFSSTLEDNSPQVHTPRKLILKLTLESLPIDPWALSMSPEDPDFWLPGTIVQLEPKSYDLVRLVDGCLKNLCDGDFSKKFEVYATFNVLCKMNDTSTLSDLFVGSSLSWLASAEAKTGHKLLALPETVPLLCRYLRRDITTLQETLFKQSLTLPVKGNPFEARTLSQALKLVALMVSVPPLAAAMPADDIRWFYTNTCESIVIPTLSKLMVLPYLCLLKDAPFPPKRRRMLFEQGLTPDHILNALMNMPSFMSSSLYNEKFIAFRNMVLNFPQSMAKTFHTWFPLLLSSLCDIEFPLYAKIVSTAVTTLLETARNFLDNTDVCLVTRSVLETAPSPAFWGDFQNDFAKGGSLILLLIDTIRTLIKSGNYKNAMDMWVGVTLLLGSCPGDFENWRHLSPWLNLHKLCFNEKPTAAKEIALLSWKVIIYKVCNEIMPRLSLPDQDIRVKAKLLIHPFLNVEGAEIAHAHDLTDAFHHCFLALIHSLFGQTRTNRLLQVSWDRIMLPVLVNFYFQKHATAHMHKLGTSLLARLLRAGPQAEKPFNPVRCLSNDPVQLSELNALNAKWLFLSYDRVIPLILMAFRLPWTTTEEKISLLTSYLATVRFFAKKEVQVSDATLDLIDNIPFCLNVLFEHCAVPYNVLFKLIVNLNDTFGAANLVPPTDDVTSVIEVVLSKTAKGLTPHQLNAILSMLYGAVGERKSLRFLLILDNVNRTVKGNDLSVFIGDSLNGKRQAKFTGLEMVLIGRMFESLNHNFTGIAKKLIQHIVLLKQDEFESMVRSLRVSHWHPQIFKFYVLLMHDAPYQHLQQNTLRLLEERLQTKNEDLVQFLFENNYHYEVHGVRETLFLSWHDMLTETKKSFQKYVEAKHPLMEETLLCAVKHSVDVGPVDEAEYPLVAAASKEKQEVSTSPKKEIETTTLEVAEAVSSSLDVELNAPVPDGKSTTLEEPQPETTKDSPENDCDDQSDDVPGSDSTGELNSSDPVVIENDNTKERETKPEVNRTSKARRIVPRVTRSQARVGSNLNKRRLTDSETPAKKQRVQASVEVGAEATKQVSDSEDSYGRNTAEVHVIYDDVSIVSSEEKTSLESKSQEAQVTESATEAASTASGPLDQKSLQEENVVEVEKEPVVQSSQQRVDENAEADLGSDEPETKLGGIERLFTALHSITDQDLVQLGAEERYRIESEMMRVMLRMREAAERRG